MILTERQLEMIRERVDQLKRADGYYAGKLRGICAQDLTDREAFEKLPFTDKADLREAYPMGLCAVPEEEVVRIHSTSGTTGMPVIVPYTRGDVEDWAEMFERCYRMAHVTDRDRVLITPAYGLWTAGIGFQTGAERVGALAVPTGTGHTDKQLQLMTDMNVTVLCATASYARLLAEEVVSRGLEDRVHIKSVIMGSERCSDKAREFIEETFGARIYDIYGLTEVYGPGIGISCDRERGIHYFDDFLYFEIIDPETGRVLPDGEEGELVITTLRKRGAPLIRYRTHDITRILPEECSCGCAYPRIAPIMGRSDDMAIVKGVNIFPAQVDTLLREIPASNGEYLLEFDRGEGGEICTLYAEFLDGFDREEAARGLEYRFRQRINVRVKVVPLGERELVRSEKKTKRFIDKRI